MELDDMIGRCTFCFTVDKAAVHQHSDGLHEQVRSQLLPAVEELFRHRQFREYRISIDRLTLDLGKVAYENGSLLEVRSKLTNALEEELLRQIRGDSGSRSCGAATLPAADADVVMFMHYLQFGCFDRKIPLAPDKLFEELLRGSPHLLVRYLRQHAAHDNVLRRLAWQFDTGLLETLIAGLEPSEHAFLAECIGYLTKDQPVAKVITGMAAEPDSRQYQRQVIEFMLQYVLVEKTVQFNRVNFVGTILSKIASRYNLGLGQLLQVLIATIEAACASEVQQVDLYIILTEIRTGMKGAAVSQRGRGSSFDSDARHFAEHLLQAGAHGETRALWDRLHHADPGRLRSFMQQHCRADVQVRTLVRAFDTERVRECIALLAPEGASYIEQFSGALDEEKKNVRSVRRHTAPCGDTGQVVNEFIVRYLLHMGACPFSEKNFTLTLLQELANHYNTGFATLLRAVIDAMIKAEVKGARMTRLHAVLQSLWCEQPDAAEPQNDGGGCAAAETASAGSDHCTGAGITLHCEERIHPGSVTSPHCGDAVPLHPGSPVEQHRRGAGDSTEDAQQVKTPRYGAGAGEVSLHGRMRQLLDAAAADAQAGTTGIGAKREEIRTAVRRFPAVAGVVLASMHHAEIVADIVADECSIATLGVLMGGVSSTTGPQLYEILDELLRELALHCAGTALKREQVRMVALALQHLLIHSDYAGCSRAFGQAVGQLFGGTPYAEMMSAAVNRVMPAGSGYEKTALAHRDERWTCREQVWQMHDRGRGHSSGGGTAVREGEERLDKGASANNGAVVLEKPGSEFPVHNAGLAIGAAYFERLFTMLHIVDNKKMVNEEALQKALALLHYFACGEVPCWEHEFVFNKLLCGCELSHPVDLDIRLSAEEKRCVDGLVAAIIRNWPKMKNTTSAGLRESFLQRSGRLMCEGDGWRLRVDPKPFDMLIDTLPWGMSVIKLPWMKDLVTVAWKWE